MNKKIAFVSDAVWPYNKGGKEKRLFDISIRLAEKGYDVHVYTMKWWKGENIKKENGVTLHGISRLYPLYSGERRSIKEGILFGFSCLRLIKENWDVIDVDHMPFFPLYSVKLICLLKGKKMFATWHEVWGRDYWIKYMGILGYVSYVIERLSVFLPNKIISISAHTTRKLHSELNCSKQIATIPIGVEVDHINEIEASKNKSEVIYVGRFLSHKNIDLLIKSIAILKRQFPKVRCVIIGDGPERQRLEKLVAELDLSDNIQLPGFVKETDDVYALMKSSKVFMLPSTREGFGIVAIEANACGLPIIVINHPENAAKDLVQNKKNGCVVDLDENEIAKTIGYILNTTEDKNIKQSCIDSAKKFNWDEIVNDIKEEYLK